MAPTLSPEILENPASGRKERVLFVRAWKGKLDAVDDSMVGTGEGSGGGNDSGSGEGDEGRQGKRDVKIGEKSVMRTLKRGSIICLSSPNEKDKLVVKRVIGLPGDIITPLSRRPKIIREAQQNSKDTSACPHLSSQQSTRLQTSPQPHPESEQEEKEEENPVTIPYGYIWIEGDNPQSSYDSNDYGPISQSLIVEIAWAPLNQA
ncbi:MAG: hypothetical protein Q9159_003820, partial [Coniocarpon cinnabarinum]